MNLETYLRFVIALVFVLALIGVLAWAARRFGVLRGTTRLRGAGRRLEVIEVAPIDAKRRLVLLRRDQTEHLVLLGTSGELLIESGIAATAPPPVPDPKPKATA
jgi:flagellar protein FliO/FliZ